MPTYEYHCRECGSFAAMRPMADFRAPCTCPICGGSATRAFLSAPSLVGAVAAQGAPVGSNGLGAKASHPAGCGCCVRRWPLPSALSSKTDRIFSSSGPVGRSGR
ncbi:FmdB family zinc ribbon protein [Roseomonas haemaphysalidis]|uniref:Zinc ribbon domain-containing protein n=1 Tax=Roseomonas haemaphysalidis TaxID=2768162 RepID=A0ABS3KLR4_9PROT|nr:zinc ribbon domain-containing protein [Roseomonas haemaphysalidis]